MKIETYVGVQFVGDAAKVFWNIKCPCGVEATYGVNELPTVDTPHPCGNPNHFAVRYSPAPTSAGVTFR